MKEFTKVLRKKRDSAVHIRHYPKSISWVFSDQYAKAEDSDKKVTDVGEDTAFVRKLKFDRSI